MAMPKGAPIDGACGSGGVAAGGDPADAKVGFAKLEGEDFEYYMHSYSIILGRNSKKSEVDADFASLGGGRWKNISRRHARIFYDFRRRHFALEVIGKNGCMVEGVLHLPGTPPVELDSQDLLQIGDKQFYFLLPSRSIFETARILRQLARPALPGPSDYGGDIDGGDDDVDEEVEEEEEDGDENEEEEQGEEEEEDGKEMGEEVRHAVARGTRKRPQDALGDGQVERSGHVAKAGPSGHLG